MGNITVAVIVRLVHVNPDAIQGDDVVECPDLVLPPALGFMCQEVRIVHSARP